MTNEKMERYKPSQSEKDTAIEAAHEHKEMLDEGYRWYKDILQKLEGKPEYEKFTDDSGPYPESAAQLLATLGLISQDEVDETIQKLKFIRNNYGKYGKPSEQLLNNSSEQDVRMGEEEEKIKALMPKVWDALVGLGLPMYEMESQDSEDGEMGKHTAIQLGRWEYLEKYCVEGRDIVKLHSHQGRPSRPLIDPLNRIN